MIEQNMRPLDLFQKHGMDTLEIAAITGMTEAKVYNEIHKARSVKIYRYRAKVAAAQKDTKAKAAAKRQLIRYAGYPG